MTPPPPSAGAPSENRTTLPRVLAVAAIVGAAVVVAIVLLSSGRDTTYKMLFQNAGQLVKGDEVQVGGRAVGSITDIRLTDDNQAEVTVEMHEFAPLHEGTTGVIRLTSLSGIANRYISLQLGPNSAPELDDGATIPTRATTTPVDLDQLFNTLDPRTRKGLQDVVQGSAEQYRGRSREANESAKYLNPFLGSTGALAREANRDSEALTRFIVESSTLVGALAERRDDLSGLVANANATAGAIASENDALAGALEVLPTTLRRGNTTFVNLRSTLDDLDVLVDETRPVAPRLAPFFRELRPLVAAARPTIADLRRLVRQPGRDNDAVELLRKAPGLARVTGPFARNAIPALQRATPVIEFIRPYTPELVGWFRDFGQTASNYDANGHYARIAPQFNAFQFSDTPAGPTLTPQDPSQRLSGGGVPNYFHPAPRRCPGGAIQPAYDGSSPWRDTSGTLDCDPSVVPPGP